MTHFSLICPHIRSKPLQRCHQRPPSHQFQWIFKRPSLLHLCGTESHYPLEFSWLPECASLLVLQPSWPPQGLHLPCVPLRADLGGFSFLELVPWGFHFLPWIELSPTDVMVVLHALFPALMSSLELLNPFLFVYRWHSLSYPISNSKKIILKGTPSFAPNPSLLLFSLPCFRAQNCTPFFELGTCESVFSLDFYLISYKLLARLGFPSGSEVKNLPVNTRDARDMGSIPGKGRSPGGGNGNLLNSSSWENPRDRGAWQAIVHEVIKSPVWLSNWAWTHTDKTVSWIYLQ